MYQLQKLAEAGLVKEAFGFQAVKGALGSAGKWLGSKAPKLTEKLKGWAAQAPGTSATKAMPYAQRSAARKATKATKSLTGAQNWGELVQGVGKNIPHLMATKGGRLAAGAAGAGALGTGALAAKGAFGGN